MTAAETASLALLIAVLATMPIFAIAGRSRPRDPDVVKRPATILLGFWVRDWLMWLIRPIEQRLVRSRVSPDVFNYLGVAFGLAAALAFASAALTIAGWMIVLGGLCDILDGRVARALGVDSRFGEFMDSTLDRFAETFTYVGLAWFLAGASWYVLLAPLALGSSLLVSYTRAKGEALGILCKSGVMQRAERLVVLAVAAFVDPLLARRLGWGNGTTIVAALMIIGAGALGTAVYRTAVIARELSRQGPR
jgi:CDP-diacylglycerol--glycerol-3-phosphate 3-phosphatidyltransferase